jgi:hypothetical protein
MFFCKTRNQKDEVSLLIQNKTLKIGDTIQLLITNNSNFDYYLPYDYINKEVSTFYPNIVTKGIGFIEFTSDGHPKNIDNIDKINSIDDVILIMKNKSITLQIPFEQNYTLSDGRKVERILNKKGKYKLHIEYAIENSFVKRNMSKQLLLELDKMKIECTKGVLVSNQVDFIVDK